MIAQQLRRSILQAAIQGKLTEQLPEDGDARDLLVKIQAEKAKLIKDGKIKKEKKLPEITEDEIPFGIPENWCWVRFSEICKLITCGYASTPQYVDQGMPIISAKNVKPYKFMPYDHKLISQTLYNKITQTCRPEKGDLLLTRVGAGIGEAAIFNVDFECAVYVSLTLIKLVSNSLLDNEYILYWLNSPIGVSSSIKNIFGANASQGNLNVKNVREFMLPIPPIAEQKRITAIIKKIRPQIDALEKDETKLKDIRQVFPKKMKDSLIHSAIQGKLTNQLESDGDARDLVADIKKEKEGLFQEGKIKKEKPLPEITEDEIPFDIPDNWCWVRLGTITYNHGQKKPDHDFTYIDISSINNSANTLGDLSNVLRPEDAPSRARKIVFEGDVIYATVRPYLHNICIIDRKITPEPIVSTGFAVVCTPMKILNHYLFKCFLSPMFDSYANSNDNSKGVAYPAINDDKFSKALVPLPPLAEQYRIIERLNQLLPLCDELEY